MVFVKVVGMKRYNDNVFKELDNIFKEVDRTFRKVDTDMDGIFKQMDNIFKQVDKRMEEAEAESWESINNRAKWEPHISWIPRKIGKRWFWHSPIYRKYQFDGSNGHFIYGTEFDVLKDSK
jgi:hypothetical protein